MNRQKKQGIAFLVLAGVLFVAGLVVLQSANAQAKNPDCRGLAGAEGSQRQVKRTIWCVANKLPHVSAHRAVRIADRETGLGQDEVNDGSGTCGIFQHQPHLWSGRYRDFYGSKRWGPGPNRCLHDRVNIIVSLTMVNRGGWGPWE